MGEEKAFFHIINKVLGINRNKIEKNPGKIWRFVKKYLSLRPIFEETI
jgi:hypothetical protein